MTDSKKVYMVTIAGVEHSLELSEEDAKRFGADAKVKQAQPANKARQPANK